MDDVFEKTKSFLFEVKGNFLLPLRKGVVGRGIFEATISGAHVKIPI